jgi:integrase
MRTGYSLLYRRQGIYRVRRIVPKEVREILGLREIKVSLRTTDSDEAKRRAAREAIKADHRIEEARRLLNNPVARAQRMVQDHVEDHRRRPRTDEELEAESMAVSDLLERETGAIAPDPARIRAFRAVLQKLDNPTEDDGQDNPLLSEVFERWRQERQPPAHTWLEWTKARQRFEVVAGDLPVREITKRHVRSFKDALMRTLTRHGVEGRTLSPASITKNLSALRSVLSWAVGQGFIENNPATGISHAGVKSSQMEAKRLPYDAEDLKRIFAVERKDGAGRWLPLLGLWTGARLEELGQLRVADVRQEGGVDYIAIEGGDGKRVKTKGSNRRVPLHPALVKLGFLDYVARQREAGHAQLFPELKVRPGRPLTGQWSKWWGRHVRSLGLVDPRKVFHSFRHGWVDAAREVMGEEHRQAITGHSGGGVGRSYGTGVPLRVLAESMAKVRYAGIH